MTLWCRVFDWASWVVTIGKVGGELVAMVKCDVCGQHAALNSFSKRPR